VDRGLPTGTVISSWIDASLGAIVARLEALGIRDDTVIIFASDHQSIGKFTCYEGSRSPCIVNWSGLPGRAVSSSALVSNIDLAPTIFDICRIEPAAEMDGRSFLPVLTGATDQVRDSLLLETAYCRAVVAADRWKYIAMRFPPAEMEKVRAGEPYHTNGTGMAGYWRTNRETVAAYPNMGQFDQLYNLREDPAEATNLFGEANHSARAGAMQNLLRRELASLPYPFAELTD
jgi:uncharacterized sulfatase